VLDAGEQALLVEGLPSLAVQLRAAVHKAA
jgi:hypothetical protein